MFYERPLLLLSCFSHVQCMKVKSENEVAQSCPTHSNPMNFSLPDSSIHGIFQARIQEWVAIAFSDERPLEKNNSYIWAIQAQIHYKHYVNSNDVEIIMD